MPRRRLVISVIVVAFIAGVAVPIIALSTLRGGSSNPLGAGILRTSIYQNPVGWTMPYPSTWHLTPPRGACAGQQSGAIVSNVVVSPTYVNVFRECTWPPSIPGAPREVVIVGFFAGSTPDVGPGMKDATFPLSLSGAAHGRVAVRGGFATLDVVSPIQIGGKPCYSLAVWVGDRATRGDRRLADSIVRSIRPEPATTAGWRASHIPALWALQSMPPDGSSITIRVATSGCVQYSHAIITRTSTTVTVHVVNVQFTPGSEGGGCLQFLGMDKEVVPLFGPLGHRKLLGACLPGDATYDQRVCSDLGIIARYP